jgi:predicted nucleic acid-binding protein
MILIDTGPLVALIHADDQNHVRCKKALQSLRGPFITVWPVFTEATYLLNFSWRAQDGLWEMLEREFFTVIPLDETDAPRMRELMRKYRDLPMDFADAALVRVAEREKIRDIFTTDRKDFEIYRPARIGRFAILPYP